MLTHLPALVPPPPAEPRAPVDDHPMRRLTRAIAFDPDPWSTAKAREVAAFFDELAPEWNDRVGHFHAHALEDAIERGCRALGSPGGVAVDVGSGTGAATASLRSFFGSVIGLDVSVQMLRRADASAAPQVLADAATMPIPDRCLDAVVLFNAFLFPREVARVLRPGGLLVWVNAIGERTPIYLPADEVVAVLPADWDALASQSGSGTWCVARRSLARL